ncbi:MAG TPA: hemolysin family protein, partial [Pyrinomonadaceae bacterium]
MDDPFRSFLFLFAAEGASAEAVTWGAAAIKAVVVLILVAANGFFVGAEFAFVSVRRSRIETLAADGVKSAQRLLGILDNLNPYLSAFQLGITLASLALGALGEPLVEALLGDALLVFPEPARHFVSYGIAFFIVTSLHIVLGEQAPKLIGLALAEKVALATALPMRIFYVVFKPFIIALDWASVRTVKLFGLEVHNEHASVYTEEEIRQLVKVSEESGHLNEQERRLINQVFEFSETTVREAMIPRTEVVAVSYDSTLAEIALAFRQNGYSRLPVYRDSLDDIAGFIHSKDLMPFLVEPSSFNLEKVIQKPMYVVDTARLEDVLRQMQREKFHFGFVVDEHGGIEGIITLEDLLEEIVGDISDEHD